MTVTVTIHVQPPGAPAYDIPITVTDLAERIVRFNFNPSGKREVDAAKLLGAALISMMEPFKMLPPGDRDGADYSAARAIDAAEDAAMHAVKALTA